MVTRYSTKHITLKLNTPLRGLREGHVLRLRTKDGIPVDRYWRRRLKDAKIDNCVEIVHKQQIKTDREVDE